MKLKERVNYVLNGEEGASNVELIVWFSVVFLIATVLFFFRDAIKGFVNKSGKRFSAQLYLDESFTVKFKFPRKKDI